MHFGNGQWRACLIPSLHSYANESTTHKKIYLAYFAILWELKINTSVDGDIAVRGRPVCGAGHVPLTERSVAFRRVKTTRRPRWRQRQRQRGPKPRAGGHLATAPTQKTHWTSELDSFRWCMSSTICLIDSPPLVVEILMDFPWKIVAFSERTDHSVEPGDVEGWVAYGVRTHGNEVCSNFSVASDNESGFRKMESVFFLFSIRLNSDLKK